MIKMRDGFRSRRYLSRFNVRVYSTEPPEGAERLHFLLLDNNVREDNKKLVKK